MNILHNAEIEASSLFEPNILSRVDDMTYKLFDEYYNELEGKELQDTEFPAGLRIQTTIQKIQDIDYSDLMKMIKETDMKKNESMEQQI